jgi:tRNA-(ms[2]io[6]A)-hydroxylase
MQARPLSHPDVQTRAARAAALAHATERVPLATATTAAWVERALDHVEVLLDDHCQCELKAASNALALIGRHPEKDDLVRKLAALAREEMSHYRQVRDLLQARGGALHRPKPSPYLQGIRGERLGERFALLDDLLVCALVEARSCERFVALAQGLGARADVPGGRELQELYEGLARSESGHATLFVDLARTYFEPDLVDRELDRRSRLEARVLDEIPITPRMHGGNGPGSRALKARDEGYSKPER